MRRLVGGDGRRPAGRRAPSSGQLGRGRVVESVCEAGAGGKVGEGWANAAGKITGILGVGHKVLLSLELHHDGDEAGLDDAIAVGLRQRLQLVGVHGDAGGGFALWPVAVQSAYLAD